MKIIGLGMECGVLCPMNIIRGGAWVRLAHAGLILVPVLWHHGPQCLHSTELLEQGYSACSGLLCNVPHKSHKLSFTYTAT